MLVQYLHSGANFSPSPAILLENRFWGGLGICAVCLAPHGGIILRTISFHLTVTMVRVKRSSSRRPAALLGPLQYLPRHALVVLAVVVVFSCVSLYVVWWWLEVSVCLVWICGWYGTLSAFAL